MFENHNHTRRRPRRAVFAKYRFVQSFPKIRIQALKLLARASL